MSDNNFIKNLKESAVKAAMLVSVGKFNAAEMDKLYACKVYQGGHCFENTYIPALVEIVFSGDKKQIEDGKIKFLRAATAVRGAYGETPYPLLSPRQKKQFGEDSTAYVEKVMDKIGEYAARVPGAGSTKQL